MLNIREVVRMFHSSPFLLNNSKLLLSKLRKKTGYTFVNCKKALEVCNNDLPQAEKWLHEQALSLGWAKANKLVNRHALQGLIGVAADEKSAVMVEVNCETDFVAKNNLFQKLVLNVANTCFSVAKEQTKFEDSIAKLHLDSSALNSLKCSDGKKLEDEITLLMSQVGEKISLKRAVCLNVSDDILVSACTHPTIFGSSAVNVGRFGAILLYNTVPPEIPSLEVPNHAAVENLSPEVPNTAAVENLSPEALNSVDAEFLPPDVPSIAKQLCQHVIGIKPAKIGDIKEDKPKENKENETCMIYQEFMMDPELTVLEVLCKSGISLKEFTRFECGEDLEKDENIEDIDVAAQAAKG